MVDTTKPHRRRNPLTGEWLLVSPHRAKRPWQGCVEPTVGNQLPGFDPSCYLCPGNTRASGVANPKYNSTFVFTNDHPSLLPDTQSGPIAGSDLFQAQNERGTSRVVCYSPSHNRTMADMTVAQISEVVKTWTAEYKRIGANDFISYVQIFENKGAIMGPSSPHPHSQIWANEHIPTIPAKEQETQAAYLKNHKKQLLLAYLEAEQKEQTRLLWENASFAVLVPFWATWPYETMILPKAHRPDITTLEPSEITDLADILRTLNRRYDTLFATQFPFSMGIHQAPTDKKPHDEWQMHFHFFPPLLRSATIKKYFVGYEMLAEAQRDINPEDAAQTLRNIHEK
ncbi:galactose-1-phosphate uridylyltransferase [Candidatus Gottesmanbacteria bacterium RBG_13_45_10]|uniref:Galactose-1-phosphate uridylyltransferase n=1 Tax=Candidatus Gottesmanbacteria bacterium RBG_13_45_10 TaxID=1798370 RepID=A0A1F5ZGN1_9BACT|nr:MAG: galactose-1-phosphate uridylyltransferase [Candidatus Gottesmanbacteria bacterium RBG_13_45_10]